MDEVAFIETLQIERDELIEENKRLARAIAHAHDLNTVLNSKLQGIENKTSEDCSRIEANNRYVRENMQRLIQDLDDLEL